MTRRTLALLLGVSLVFLATPALASLVITNRMTAGTQLVSGPRFYRYSSGSTATIGQPTNWDGFSLDGLTVAADGTLELDRGGLAAPSDQTWWDEAWTARVCGVIGGEAPTEEPPAEEPPAEEPPVEEPPVEEPPVEEPLLSAFSFDAATEIAAGRLLPDLADLRVVDIDTGQPVPHRVTGEPSSATQVLVEIDPAGATLCAYWGSPEAATIEDSSLSSPLVADGAWTWERWDEAGDGLSLDIVDWSAAPAITDVVTTAEAPADVCDRCASELTGVVIAPASGSYRFFVSANEVATLELGAGDDAATLAPIVTITAPTPVDEFESDPTQVSEPVDLIEGEAYTIRARAKELIEADHLQVAWSLDTAPPSVIDASALRTSDGIDGALTYRRFDTVATVDLSSEPTETVAIAASENTGNSCDLCAHRISGFVLIETSGTHRFWLSSDDEGTLRLAPDGDPASASVVASTPTYVPVDDWTSFESQGSATVELVAGQVLWIEATNRDAGGPDHLQVGWSIETDEVDPASGEPLPPVVSLIPEAQLSSVVPQPAEVPTTPFTGPEGLYGASGSFVSAVIDTTDDGSNVHGLLAIGSADQPLGAAVDVRLAAAASPEGPWVAVGPERDPGGSFVSGDPVPLAFDGIRYLRVEGTLTTVDRTFTPGLTAVSVGHDLVEQSSVDSVSTLSVSGVADHYLLRIKGSAGDGVAATIEIQANGVLTGVTASSWLELPRASQVVIADGAIAQGVGVPVAFGTSAPQHLGLTVDALDAGQGNTLRMRWVAVGAGGALITHDLVIDLAS